jgi:glycosyltransferase involved in cell wall biosynthesis
MTYRVHIKIADRDWILERCASEIAKRAANVTYGETADYAADIQYYLNYSARKKRISPVEIAFFTHSEQTPSARARYFEAAREVDVPVCMSRRYADELREAGIGAVETIAPGVDLEEFRPKVRIGVIGRTYQTGRKGEALVASVMDVEGIDWKFTGQGWPGEAVYIPPDGMPDFYNGLDYVLIPSHSEGGPMSVLEALACGKPIISSDVGWVNEFPHIPFENGNAESLRAVLKRLVEERRKLSERVQTYTWDNWAAKHIQLFQRLAASRGLDGTLSVKALEPALKVILATHAAEGKALGGPTVRIPRTAVELSRHNVDAVVMDASADQYGDRPVAHVFNIWPPRSALAALLGLRRAGKATVFSPIFLNLSKSRDFNKDIPRIFETMGNDGKIEAALRPISENIHREPKTPTKEPSPGYHSLVRAAVAVADRLILLSDYERSALAAIGADVSRATIVRNAVDAPRFAAGDPSLFAEAFGVQNYVLCVGRIEARKNQLLVAYAARQLGLRSVFIGHGSTSRYGNLVKEFAGSDTVFVPRIDHDGPMLPSAYAGAAAFCLPSWAEGAPLAAMEAAAAGAPLVLSDRSGESEYFGAHAEYVNPADIDGLKRALETAVNARADGTRRLSLQKHMAENFSWQRYAEETAKIYKSIEVHDVAREPLDGRIFLDLTTTYRARGTPTGIARLEREVFESLLKIASDRVVPIAWNSLSGRYLTVPNVFPPPAGGMEALAAMEASGEARELTEGDVLPGSFMLCVGGAWVRREKLCVAIAVLRARLNLPVVMLVHDLIQSTLAALYPPGAGEEFHRSASLIANVADAFLVYSEATRRDLTKLLLETGTSLKPIVKFKMGNTLGQISKMERSTGPSPRLTNLQGKKFALFVSSVDPRKNHILLFNVWRRLIELRGAAAPHLLLVGRPFWNGEEIIDVVKRDPALSRHVHVISHLADEDLDWCYRNAAFTLFPSIYEGWGLPIAESLSYGKFCIVADASSTKEVAPDLTDLLDPYDFKAWLNRITLYFDNPAALAAKEAAIKARYVPYPWSDAVREIVRKVVASGIRKPGPPVVEPFSRLELTGATAELSQAVLLSGWRPPSGTGTELSDQEGRLRFRYTGAGPSSWIRIHFAPADASRSLKIEHGGVARQVEIEAKSRSIDLELGLRPGEEGTCLLIRRVDDCHFVLTHLSLADSAYDLNLLGPAIVAKPASTSQGRNRNGVRELSDQRKSEKELRQALSLVRTPDKLSNRRLLYRLLKLTGLERLALRLHGLLLGRTNRAIRIALRHLLKDGGNRG